ncbi:hypothetical protein BH23GEM7_BH23GEM7_02800 [soil metagenome]
MADIDVERKATARPTAGGGIAQQTWIWALVAVLAVAGLMWWLAAASESARETAVVQETGRDPAGGAPGAGATPAGEAAELGGIAAAPETFVGRRIAVDDVQVAATLGPRAFWADVPGANPFLVLFAPDLAGQPQLASGQTLNVQGTVAAVTDSLLDVWVQSEAIRPNARDEAAFATHYLLADLITAQ